MKASSTIEEVTIESLKEMSKGGHIDNDLILFDDIASVPFPYGPRRMGCLLLALCLKGKAQYSVNTEKHEVEQNHIIIINEGQVTDDFLLSRDCNGIALLISTSFFREIIKNVHELSSLLLFSRNHPVWKLTPNETKTIVEYFRLLKAKVNDKEHHFRKDTVRLLLTTMIYDLSNAIYKVQQTTNEKKQTRAEHIFTEFTALYHAQIPVGSHQTGQPSHTERVDRQLRNTGNPRVAEELNKKYQGDSSGTAFPQPVVSGEILQGTCGL